MIRALFGVEVRVGLCKALKRPRWRIREWRTAKTLVNQNKEKRKKRKVDRKFYRKFECQKKTRQTVAREEDIRAKGKIERGHFVRNRGSKG